METTHHHHHGGHAHSHDHEHSHDHSHDTATAEQAQLGPSEDGTVVLDIGGDVGALVLMTGPALHLVELEISRVDGAAPLVGGGGYPVDGGLRTHVAVRERRGEDGVRYAAIYPGLWTGEYTVHGVDGRPVDTVHVVGGQVAELDWSGA